MKTYGIYKNGESDPRDVVEATNEKDALRVFGNRKGLINTGSYRAYEHSKGKRIKPRTAQGIISDIILNVRRGKQNFTFFELQGMTEESNPGLTWDEFHAAIKLTVLTGEVLCSVSVNSNLVDIAIFTPGRTL